MIEVNLLPGGKKRSSRGGAGFSFKLPTLSSMPTDRWILGSGAVIVLVVVAMGYLYTNTNAKRDELTLAVEEAQADSVRYFDFIERKESLDARKEAVAQRVSIIQTIDSGRYIWPHIMDEVARAVPEYTWLRQIVQVSGGEEVQFRVQGLAVNPSAYARFIENLAASPFIRGVDFLSSQQETVTTGTGTQRVMIGFEVEAFFDSSSVEFIETVPLFEETATVEGEAPETAQDAVPPPPDTAQASGQGIPSGGH